MAHPVAEKSAFKILIFFLKNRMIRKRLFENFKEYLQHNVKLMEDIVVLGQKVLDMCPVKYLAWVQPLPQTVKMSWTSALIIADTAPLKLPHPGPVLEFLLEITQTSMVYPITEEVRNEIIMEQNT